MVGFSGQVGPDKPINMFGSQVSAVAHAAGHSVDSDLDDFSL